MPRKRWKHPLDKKTGRVVFTPVLRSTGERLDLEVDYASFPRSKALGFHGYTQDVKIGQWYAVYGKECDIVRAFRASDSSGAKNNDLRGSMFLARICVFWNPATRDAFRENMTAFR